jgi:hypothetical protein
MAQPAIRRPCDNSRARLHATPDGRIFYRDGFGNSAIGTWPELKRRAFAVSLNVQSLALCSSDNPWTVERELSKLEAFARGDQFVAD